MMRTVHLHGPLARFGAVHRLDVACPAEAVRALVAHHGVAFRQALREGEWRIVAGPSPDKGDDYGFEGMAAFGLGAHTDLHIAPAAGGAKDGFFQAILGVALLATAFVLAPPVVGPLGPSLGMGTTAFSAFGQGITFSQLAMTGGLMALGGVSQMLSPVPQLSSGYSMRDDADDRRSYLFDGPKNTTAQGGPVPVIYGRQRVGWTLISSGTIIEQVKGTSGGGSHEAVNTLQSKAIIRAVGAIGEGVMKGLVDGEKSIYFGDTPLMAEDGTYNFEGVTWYWRPGTADQEYIPGFPAVENEVDVQAEVSSDTPVTRTITNTDVDAARIRLRLPSLYKQEGNIVGNSVDVAIDVRASGGDWVEKIADTIAGKTTSRYERAYRVELDGDGPWDIRVRKLTADSEVATAVNTVNWQSTTEITDVKMIYPHTALFGVEIDSELFGESIESVSIEVYGREISVPTNYDPETREYDGLWDGTFTQAYSDNPSWCVYDMVTNERFGAGPINADKWELYEMARYNDGLVDDGYGGQEPRFTMNCVLSTREEAYGVINNLVSVCRGQVFWASGAVSWSQDRPKEPSHVVTQADVKDGEFKRGGTSIRSRNTAANVTWNDPADGYRAGLEPEENFDGILRYGYQPVDVVDLGARTKGQAARTGRWKLETDLNATDTLEFTAGLKYADALPGDVIMASDAVFAGVRFGGRVKSASATQVVMDAPVALVDGEIYTITLVLPDKTSVDVDVTTGPGTTDTLDLADTLETLPQAGSSFILSASTLLPELYTVLTNDFSDIDRHDFVCVAYDPDKFPRVEQGLRFDPRPVSSIVSTRPAQPLDLSIDEYLYRSGEVMAPGIILSWTHPPDGVYRYEAQILRPGQPWESPGIDTGTSAIFENTRAGVYSFRVRSVTRLGAQSAWLELTNRTLLGMAQAPNDVTGVVLVTRGRNNVLAWDRVEDYRQVTYEVRKGSNWDTALFIGSTSENSLPIGGTDGTYLLRAYAGGAYSDNVTTTVVDGGVVTDNVVATLDEKAGGWPGTMTGDLAEDASGNLWLTGAELESGTYQIATADVVSLSALALCRVSMDYDVYAHGLNDDLLVVEDILALANVLGNHADAITVTPQIRLYKNSAWGDWQRFLPGEYAAEAFDFRMVLASSTPEVTPVLTRLVITVDVPDRVETGRGVTVPTTGLAVAYPSDFNAVPTVVCQMVDAQGGEDVVLSGETVSGFNVVVTQGGSPVERTLNYVVQGY